MRRLALTVTLVMLFVSAAAAQAAGPVLSIGAARRAVTNYGWRLGQASSSTQTGTFMDAAAYTCSRKDRQKVACWFSMDFVQLDGSGIQCYERAIAFTVGRARRVHVAAQGSTLNCASDPGPVLG
jgi:hypothetical protein